MEGKGYGTATQNHEYLDHPGVVIVPRSYGDPVLVKIHAPYGTRRVTFNSFRQDRPPEIPFQGDLADDKYVGGGISLPLPTPCANGDGFNWIVSGVYEYLQVTNRVADGEHDFPTGIYPFLLPLQEEAAAIVQESIGGGGSQEGVDAAADSLAQLNDDSFPYPFTQYPRGLINADLLS